MVRLVILCLFSTLILSTNYAQIYVDQDNDVGINKTNPNNEKFHIKNDNRRTSAYVLNSYNTSSNKYGVYNLMENGNAETVGFYSRLRLGTGRKIGYYAKIEQTGSEGIYGSYKSLTSDGSGFINGTRNIINVNQNSARIYGFDTTINKDNSHDEDTYGLYTYTRLGPDSEGRNYGVRAVIAEHGNADENNSPDKNYGVYSYVEDHLEGYSGYFTGKPVYILGQIFSGSDKRLKEDIKELKDSKKKLKELKPMSYKLKQRGKKDDRQSYGFIAQEVSKVFPDLVKLVEQPGEIKRKQIKKEERIKNEDGTETIIPAEYIDEQEMDGEPMYAMDYNGFIALIVDALNEQDDEVTELKKSIDEMQKALDQCGCGETRGKSNGLLKDDTGFNQTATPIILANKLSVKIYPNPTDNDATLEIHSEESGLHQVHVYDEQGRLVHQEEIFVSSGRHQHEIQSSNWAGGLYYVSTTYNGISKSLKLIVAGN